MRTRDRILLAFGLMAALALVASLAINTRGPGAISQQPGMDWQPGIHAAVGSEVTTYTLTLQPDAANGYDASLSNYAHASNVGTAISGFISGADGGALSRILLKFDLTSLPAGATIESATLTLTILNLSGNDALRANRILPANSGWTEMGATWDHAVENTVEWAGSAGCGTSGTDYASTLLATQPFTATGPFTSTLNPAEFAAMRADNHGMVLRNISYFQAEIALSDHSIAAYRPKLVIVYTAESSTPMPTATLTPTAGPSPTPTETLIPSQMLTQYGLSPDGLTVFLYFYDERTSTVTFFTVDKRDGRVTNLFVLPSNQTSILGQGGVPIGGE